MKISKKKIGSTYVVQINDQPTNIGIMRNSQREFKGSADWDVIDLSAKVDTGPGMKYFSSSSLNGAFEMVKSFINNTTIKDGQVKLSK